MFIASMLMLAQTDTTFDRPNYFIPVFLGMFLLGAVAWLIAVVLGFARARAGFFALLFFMTQPPFVRGT